MSLVIDLQEGFEGDKVVVSLDSREVFRKAEVRTRYQISRAESITLEATPGRHAVEVSLPDKDIAEAITIDVRATPFLGVSLERGALVLKPSSDPFRYL